MSDYRILFGQYDTCVRINVNAWKCSQMIYRQRANADCIYTIHVDLHTLIYTHVWITIKKTKNSITRRILYTSCMSMTTYLNSLDLQSAQADIPPERRLLWIRCGENVGRRGSDRVRGESKDSNWLMRCVFVFFFPDAGCNCWLMSRAFFFSSSLLRIKIATKINGSLLCFVFWSELLKCGSWISRGRSALSGSGRPEVLMVGLVLLLNQLLGLWRGPWQPWQMPCL